MSSSDALPSLVTPATTEETSKTCTILKVWSDRSDSSSIDSLSPLVLSLAKSSVLQQVVDSDKSAQFPITPGPYVPYNSTTPSATLPDQIPRPPIIQALIRFYPLASSFGHEAFMMKTT